MESQENPTSSESVIERVSRLKTEVFRRVGSLKFNELILGFAKKIQQHHPDYKLYGVYHKLIGSTPPDNVEFIGDDFEGEDSVEEFFKSLLEGKKYE